MSKLSKGLTITAVSAALAGSIGFAYAQSSSTGQGSAANPSATTSGTMSTPSTSGMSNTTDTSRSTNQMNTQNNSTGTTGATGTTSGTTGNSTGTNSSTNLERGTGANANDGLNTMPATGAGNETSAPSTMSPDRPPRADRN
ncbi:MAG: hypothetical protein C0487_19230 [Leptothrix sp. (in: Bacteria)]|nr:hypothetical protein [Leptothrix sp. (in: b-proteobacteria)]